jgi:glycosyltransferase involved in cell wall biosynthesis
VSPALPRVSIGMPVRNGEPFLEQAVDSILAQTFTDFELVVADNASTDSTARICTEYAGRDPRVRYVRHDVDIGAAANFRHVFELSRAPYFKWAAHDDAIAPEFLERCVAVLDADPSIVVCQTLVRIIDAAGRVVGDDDTQVPRAGSWQPHERFADLVRYDYCCYEVLGLIRSSVLRQTRLIADFIASDRSLRAELGLRGRYHEVPELLFLSRDHAGRSTRAMPQHHQRGAWWTPSLAGRHVLPHWRILGEYVATIWRVPLSPQERLRCHLALLGWLGVKRNLKWLAADLVIAIEPRTWDWFERFRTLRPGAP